jgi:hypothetical protein
MYVEIYGQKDIRTFVTEEEEAWRKELLTGVRLRSEAFDSRLRDTVEVTKVYKHTGVISTSSTHKNNTIKYIRS